jgi:hypothetical protein
MGDQEPPMEDAVDQLEYLLRYVRDDFEHSYRLKALEVLDTAHSLIRTRQSRALLSPSASEISSIISTYFLDPATPQPIPAIQKRAAELMAVCYTCLASQEDGFYLNHAGRDPDHERAMKALERGEDEYARLIINWATVSTSDTARKQVLLEVTVSAISDIKGYRAGVPIIAAWTVLRKVNGRFTKPEKRIIWPEAEVVTEYLDTVFDQVQADHTSGDYASTLRDMLDARVGSDLPSSTEALRSRITAITREGNEGNMIELWQLYRDYARVPRPHQPAPAALYQSSTRNDVLSRFVYGLTSLRFDEIPPARPHALERNVQQVLSLIPKPYPRDVIHSLIAHKAKVYEDAPALEQGNEVISLSQYDEHVQAVEAKYDLQRRTASAMARRGNHSVDTQIIDESARKDMALTKLKETWQMLLKDGIERDVKVYMLLIEGLGRLGDLEGLQEIWNDLVKDEDCRKLYIREEGSRELRYLSWQKNPY